MNQILDPLLQMCAMSASQLQPADMAAYVINCMHSIKFMLSLYEFTDKRLRRPCFRLALLRFQQTLPERNAYKRGFATCFPPSQSRFFTSHISF